MTLTLSAYAKINLFLDVTGRRENGYHDIRSVMQAIDLADTVTVTVGEGAPKGITLECDAPAVPTDEKNLAYRAARAFYDALGREEPTHIVLKKRIPMEAGLAGGSTDAAAVLVALNRIFSDHYSEEHLSLIGKRLGADVPFCIQGGTALVSGIGDQIEPISALPSLPIVVAKKGGGVSTPEAYRALDERFDHFAHESHGGTVPASQYEAFYGAISMRNLPAVSAGLYNVFETVVLPYHREAAELKAFFLKSGASAALMSGSGPSVFAIFEDLATAERAAAELNRDEAVPIAFVTSPVPRHAISRSIHPADPA